MSKTTKADKRIFNAILATPIDRKAMIAPIMDDLARDTNAIEAEVVALDAMTDEEAAAIIERVDCVTRLCVTRLEALAA